MKRIPGDASAVLYLAGKDPAGDVALAEACLGFTGGEPPLGVLRNHGRFSLARFANFVAGALSLST